MLPNFIQKSVYICLHNCKKAAITHKSVLTQLKYVSFCTKAIIYLEYIKYILLYLHMNWSNRLT